MVKKWTIDNRPPRKVRVVGMTEADANEGRTVSRFPRVRAVGSRVVKAVVALWVMSVGTWLQAYIHGSKTTDNERPRGAIGDDKIDLF